MNKGVKTASAASVIFLFSIAYNEIEKNNLQVIFHSSGEQKSLIQLLSLLNMEYLNGKSLPFVAYSALNSCHHELVRERAADE
jgi:hypothetical protein